MDSGIIDGGGDENASSQLRTAKLERRELHGARGTLRVLRGRNYS